MTSALIDSLRALNKALYDYYSTLRGTRKDFKSFLKYSKNVSRQYRLALETGNLTHAHKLSVGSLLTNVLSIRAQIKRQIAQNSSDNEDDGLSWIDGQSAFQRRICCGIIVNHKFRDPGEFLSAAKNRVISCIQRELLAYPTLKVHLYLNAFYAKPNEEDAESQDLLSFCVRSSTLTRSSDLDSWFDNTVIDNLLTQMQEFYEGRSSLSLTNILNLCVNVNHCQNFHAGTYVPTPKYIRNTRSVLNIQNEDDYCFLWSINAHINPDESSAHSYRVSSYPHFLELRLNLTNLEFPLKVKDVSKFENQNTSICVNVFGLENSEVFPLHISERYNPCNILDTNSSDKDDAPQQQTQVDLLLISEDDKKHYALIRNMSGLLRRQLPGGTHNKKYFCKRCLHYFYNAEKLQSHALDCNVLNKNCAIKPSKETEIRFKSFAKQLAQPFVLYCDAESILKEPNYDQGSPLKGSYQEHQLAAIGYCLYCNYDESLTRYAFKRGENCGAWFAKSLGRIVEEVEEILDTILPMEMTAEEKAAHERATICGICSKSFTETDKKVADHNHLTGRFRYSAHNSCNVNLKTSFNIPIIFHNFSNYDAHLIIRYIGSNKYINGSVKVIPANMEKYIAIIKYVNESKIRLTFIDSYRFLPCSIDKLASYLPNDKKKILRAFCKSGEEFELLTRKGIFPYDFVTSFQVLENTTALPPKQAFYSKLNDSDVSDSDHAHAQRVWDFYQCKNLGDFCDVYMRTDIFLLADIYENFRILCMKTYNLDPSAYVSLPGLTFDSMLKYTGVTLEIINDAEILFFLERGVRGGIVQANMKYAKANNPFMSNYNPHEDTSYILYLDANNLYGWAMSQHLPQGEFQFLEKTELDSFQVENLDILGEWGYIVECDIEYPEELHDYFNDYPVCAEKGIPPGAKYEKLLLTLNKKERYIVHFRTLLQAVHLGIKYKIIRVLRFKQSAWLKSYVDLNTRLRQSAENDFEKTLFKFFVNACFGKFMENKRKHSNVKILNKWEGRHGAETLISSPLFKRVKVFEEDLVAIELRQPSVVLDRPIYVGVTILDISKTLMYDFHYNYIVKNYNCRLIYSDTDSLAYLCKVDNVYDIIKRDIDFFDTSNYPKNNIHKIPLVNNKILGLFKDEADSAIIEEMVCLKPKMYALKMANSGEEKKRAKGVKHSIVKNKICFSDYMKCLKNRNIVQSEVQNLIRSKNHTLYTISQRKNTLSANDDKRYWQDDCINSYAHGHCKIKK